MPEKECPNCGNKITDENPVTRQCPCCNKDLCEACDMGMNTVCFDCEAEDAEGE